ncbi:Serine/threonine-protein kinase pim-1, partial [Lamprotornis superbus]
GAAAPAASAAAPPARAPPLGSAAAGPEPPLSRSKERTPEAARPGEAEGRSGAAAGKAQQGLKERYRLGSLLGRGGFGSVWAATRLSDGAPVAIKRMPQNRVRRWDELVSERGHPTAPAHPWRSCCWTRCSLVPNGFPGVVQLLEWLEVPNNILMVLARPEQPQDLQYFLRARGFLSEEVARELFRQVLEAVRHCTSCWVLHRDIKPENVRVDLATGQAKLIDFGCGTYLQDTAYTHFAGKPTQQCAPSISCPNISGSSLGVAAGILPFAASHGTEFSAELLLSGDRWGASFQPCWQPLPATLPRTGAGAALQKHPPPEWTQFGWYYGKPATIWSLGILLHQMVYGEHPFRRGQNISWDHQLSLPQRLSQGGSSSLGTGGIPVLGDSSRLVSILLWQLLRGVPRSHQVVFIHARHGKALIRRSVQ